MLATGTSAAIPPIPGLDEVAPWTSREATSSSTVPARLAILGGGYEYAVDYAVNWCTTGSTVRVLGIPDTVRTTFPDGPTFEAQLLAQVLGFDFRESNATSSWEPTQVGDDTVVTLRSGGFDVCASAVDILSLVGIAKVMKSKKWLRASPSQREQMLKSFLDKHVIGKKGPSTLERFLDRAFPNYAAALYDLVVRVIEGVTPLLLGRTFDELDELTNVCVSAFDPVFEFTLRPDGTASMSVEENAGLLFEVSHRRAFTTAASGPDS